MATKYSTNKIHASYFKYYTNKKQEQT